METWRRFEHFSSLNHVDTVASKHTLVENNQNDRSIDGGLGNLALRCCMRLEKYIGKQKRCNALLSREFPSGEDGMCSGEDLQEWEDSNETKVQVQLVY